jgi:glycosyltransferase involved in cell wall biosynthesis
MSIPSKRKPYQLSFFHNESNYIEDCLKSVSFANQIIIVDSFSSDNTIALAKILIAKSERKFDNFSNQKTMRFNLQQVD